jgi:hypothetical protein
MGRVGIKSDVRQEALHQVREREAIRSPVSRAGRNHQGLDLRLRESQDGKYGCAFVLTKDGIVRYAARSKSLEDCRGFVRPGQKVPVESLAARLLQPMKVDGPIEVAATEWLDDWKGGGFLMEDARHFAPWNQTLSLLWFKDDRVPDSGENDADDDDEEPALRPLDGVLPWPSKRGRR